MVFNEQHSDCTRSWSVKLSGLHELLLSQVSKHLFTISASSPDGLSRIFWETILFHYELMQIIFKEISACVTSMSIVNCKERAFGPVLHFLFTLWSNYVENDWYSIFIVISDDTLISVSCIRMNDAILFRWKLCRLFIWEH